MPKSMELTELDKKVLYYQDRGHLVPSRELIKTPEQIEAKDMDNYDIFLTKLCYFIYHFLLS